MLEGRLGAEVRDRAPGRLRRARAHYVGPSDSSGKGAMRTTHGEDVKAEDGGRLRGRRILLTGASSGVGLEATRLLAAEGARLVILARRGEALEQLRRRARSTPSSSPSTSPTAPPSRRRRDAAAELGGLDVVVSNAASTVFGHVLEVHPDDFDRTIAVTFGGAVT